MSHVLFRIPDTNLYLRPDGLLSPDVLPGEEVQTLTEADAPVLEAAYVGRSLQLMSGTEPAWKTEAETLTLGLELIDIFTFGFAEWGFKLNKWSQELQFGPEPDPYMRALARLDATLRRIEDASLASWASSRRENLAFLRAHSSTALYTVRAFLASGRPPSDPLWAPKIALAERDSLLAVHTFVGNVDDGVWRRPNSVKALSWMGDPTLWDGGWMSHIPDRAEVSFDGTVWDHRWTLPAAVYAISVRIAVLKGFGSTAVTQSHAHCHEIQQYANFLESVFFKMQDGVRALRLSDMQRHEYRSMGRVPVAAADIQGGHFMSRIMWAIDWDPARFAPGLYPSAGMVYQAYHDEHVFANVERLAALWWNLVCVAIGLPEVLALIGSLRNMCTPTWFSRVFVEVQQKLSAADRDETSRRAAAAATGISGLVQGDDAQADAVRTARLYQTLRIGGDRARTITARYVDDLSELAASIETTSSCGSPEGRPKTDRERREATNPLTNH